MLHVIFMITNRLGIVERGDTDPGKSICFLGQNISDN